MTGKSKKIIVPIYLKRHFSFALIAQAYATVYAHHARTVVARRVVTDRPALVVLGNEFADLHFELCL
jgi:hypothetical protein